MFEFMAIKLLSGTHFYSACCFEWRECSRPCATGLSIRQHALPAQLLHQQSGWRLFCPTL